MKNVTLYDTVSSPMNNQITDIVCLVHNNYMVTSLFVDHLFKNTNKFNLIFVDNGSTEDRLLSFLDDGQRQSKWNVVRSDTNLGVIGGRNLGHKHVNADYFLNIDNDQLVFPNWLENLYKTINLGYDVVGVEAWMLSDIKQSRSINVDGIEQRIHGYFPVRKCTNKKDRFSYIGCGGMLIKNEVVKSIGLFDEQFSPAYYEDPDFCFRCLKNGYRIGWSSDSKIHHLAHQTMNYQKGFDKHSQFVRSWYKFYKKWYPYYPELMSMET